MHTSCSTTDCELLDDKSDISITLQCQSDSNAETLEIESKTGIGTLLKVKVDHAPVWSIGGVLISLSVAVEPVGR